MTNDQFKALSDLIRLRTGPSKECARLVLVEQIPTADAARATGMTYNAAHQAVKRARAGLELARTATPKSDKWYAFDSANGSRQKRPPERKLVLVRMVSAAPGSLPEGIAVGYMKNAAGDKQSPYFVVPGLHTGTVLAWCDCLPEGFEWPRSPDPA